MYPKQYTNARIYKKKKGDSILLSRGIIELACFIEYDTIPSGYFPRPKIYINFIDLNAAIRTMFGL